MHSSRYEALGPIVKQIDHKLHEPYGLVQFVVFVVRDGCKTKEILSNHGKMHKALYGRIKDELQLNIMVIGPSGLHFGL